MNLNYSLQFDRDKDAVMALFSHPDYFPRHQTLLGGRNIEVLERSDDGDEFYIKFHYEVASDVPAFARKVLGDTSSVMHEERWNRVTGQGRVIVDVATLPGTLECDARVDNNGAGSQKTFDWEIKVKIPLIGGKIEKVVADDITSKSRPDQDAVNQLLAEMG